MLSKNEDFWGVDKLINEHGGIDNFRCFILLPKIQFHIPFGSICSDKHDWVECKLSKSRYNTSTEYNITLIPAKAEEYNLYVSRTFHQSDFMLMIKNESIILKMENCQHIEHVKCIEPLCGGAYLVHEFNTVI